MDESVEREVPEPDGYPGSGMEKARLGEKWCPACRRWRDPVAMMCPKCGRVLEEAQRMGAGLARYPVETEFEAAMDEAVALEEEERVVPGAFKRVRGVLAGEPVGERDAELVARVEARVANYKLRELCEERSCIEAFLRDGGLTEREEDLAQLWLRWDDVAHGKAWPGQNRPEGAATPEYAEKLRSGAYADLAASYAQAVGRPGSEVRAGEDPRRHNEEGGGLVLSMESVRERAEGFEEPAPVLTEEMMQHEVERSFESGGAPGPANVMAWLDGWVQAMGDDIAGELSRMGAYEETLRDEWVSLQRRKPVLEGQRIVVGALVRAIEEREG